MELFLPHGPLGGRVASIASKSQLQRLLLCAALADRETVVHGASDAADVQAMCRCLWALGARVTADGKTLRVQPVTEQAHGAADCGESGATLRFLLPVAAALGRETTFRLHGRLPQRPLGPLWEALEAHGVRLSRPAPGELLCAGRLESGRFLLPGDVSSQFFSGLLFALPLLSGPSELRAATPPESAGYIAMTLAALRRFGIAAEPLPDGWAVPGGQRYRSPGAVRAEGDWSNAAFWLAAGALSRPVTVTGLQAESGQGDRVILEYLRRFGAEVAQNADAVTVRPAPLRGLDLDVRATPDLAAGPAGGLCRRNDADHGRGKAAL